MRKDEISLHGVFSYLVPDLWHDIAPMLVESLKYADGKFSLRSVFDALITKNMQLWIGVTKKNEIKAFAITEIVNYPAKKVLIIQFAGGHDMDTWLHNIDGLQNFAKFHDCEAVEIYGREGWAKKLLPYNYAKIHSVYRLEIGKSKNAKDLDEISI